MDVCYLSFASVATFRCYHSFHWILWEPRLFLLEPHSHSPSSNRPTIGTCVVGPLLRDPAQCSFNIGGLGKLNCRSEIAKRG
ncbi:hypothetical protein NA56DRAFT_333055 [Hyaloscypha hepaticicola]|uniref:Uncharacterized protein n=1 Tax=Hyaloscypha hepaticicola TaxID=2082293 RepID=A0A2J6PNK4_9HELO|nr:hypothetical protein NA56DRAFT_333055 [Hyaloscypha hepaticicola]